jgi:hypothetical protein
MDFSKYIFRSHYQGSLVSVPKPLTENQMSTLLKYREKEKLTPNQKNDWHDLEVKLNNSNKYTLSETAKNLLSNIVFYEKQSRNFILENKYFDKGIEVEKQGRDLVSKILGIKLTADEERKQNDWVNGKRDVKNNDLIIDNKACFSFETFNKHLLEKSHEYYFRQLDCYMDLWNIKDSLLAFTLVDTPFKLINDEIRREDWKKDILTIEGDIKEEKIPFVVNLIQNHIYTREKLEEYCHQSQNVKIEWFINFKEIPIKERVHFVSHSFDKARIEQRNESLTLCRQFMSDVKPMNNLTLNF